MPVPKLRFKDEQGQEYPKWESMKLGESTYIERGGSPRPINRYITNNPNGINWIKIGDAPVEGNVITSVKEKIIPEGVSKSRKVFKGDLILSNSMSYGRPYLLAVDGCIHDGWLLIRNDKNIFDIRFLMQELSSQYVKTQYDRLSNQGVVSNLNKELVKSVLIKIPSLPEQEKIADFLSSYDRMIDVQSQRVEAMKTRKKGLLRKIFSQEIRFKDDHGQNYPEWGKNIFGKVIQRKSKTALSTKDLPGVEYEDIISGLGRLNKNIYEKQSGKKGIVFSKGDVLYGKLRPYLKNWLLPNFHGVAIGDFWVLTSSFVIAPFLYYFIQSDTFAQVANTSIGTKMPRADWKLVQAMTITIPSLPEQQKIADFLTAMDAQIEVEEKRLETMKTIKKGLLQQMFI